MAMKENVRRFQDYGWTSQMVENSRQQQKIEEIHSNLTNRYVSIRYIMDVSQCWCNTPQDHTYWSRIAGRL